MLVSFSGWGQYHSQEGEDKWICDHLAELGLPEVGTFCEVGAADGIKFSNTLAFEKKGWRGVLVEPDPRQIHDTRCNRPVASVVECAIGEQQRPFSISDHDVQWSGFLRSKDTRTINVPVRRLDDVLHEAGIKNLDILSIDTEGSEVEVWKTRGSYSPTVVIMEFVTWDLPGNEERVREQVAQMQADGYDLAGRSGLNNIWLKKDRDRRPIRVLSHAGDYGDLIYGMSLLRRMQDIRVQLVLYPCPSGPRCLMGQERANGILPLLLSQPYIHGAHWLPEPKGMNLEPFRKCWDPQHTIIEAYCRFFGVGYNDMMAWEPWLGVRPDKQARVVVSRSLRYQSHAYPWAERLSRISDAAFVGSEEEWRAFSEIVPIRYIKTPNLLSAARVIAGADLFLGNQSAPLALAIGLGVPHVVECFKDQCDCVYNAPNSEYVK